MQSNLSTIRHGRWFEEHATQSTVRILIRILKDVRRRFDGFRGLSVWALELLVGRLIAGRPTKFRPTTV